MKKKIIRCALLLALFYQNAKAQGLLEQIKFYTPTSTTLTKSEMFTDTLTAYIDLNTLQGRRLENLQSNSLLDSAITSLISQYKSIAIQKTQATGQEINNLNERINLLIKQLSYVKSKAADAIKKKNLYVSDNLKANVDNYKKALEGYLKNIKDIRENRDSNNVLEIQRLRDSTALILFPIVLNFQKQIDSLKIYFDQFNEYTTKTDTLNYFSNDSLCNNIFDKINNLDKNVIQKTKDSIENITKSYLDKYNKFLKGLENNKSTKEQLAAIPGFSSLLSRPELIPEISFLAGKDFNFRTRRDRLRISGEIKLFTTPTASSTTDSTTLSDRQKVFIASASNYGIVSQFTLSTIKNRDSSFRHLGINLSANFLGKNFKPDSTEQFNVVTLNFKVGGEWAFWKGLSVYGNLNTIMFLTNIEELNTYLNAKENKTHWFFDVGSKILLDLTDDNSFGLSLDLNLILINPDVKHDIYPSRDPVIPNIKIGLRKNL